MSNLYLFIMIIRKRNISDVIRLFENVNNIKLPKKSLLNETKETRGRAISILKSKDVENPENVLGDLLPMDKTKNELLLPTMAFFYGNKFGDVFQKLTELINTNQMTPPLYTREGIKLNDEVFTDFLKFGEFVHGEYESKIGDSELLKVKNVDVEKTEDKPIFDKNGIEIFEGTDRDRCITYTRGGLTGKEYSFCIGDKVLSKNMWQSYRDKQVSTFYFVVDRNRDFDKDPLHFVVVDHLPDGYSLTDANNTTGNISEYGNNWKGYFEYLETKGVKTDEIFPHKPKTPEEIEDEKIVGRENQNLEYFKNLSYEYKYKYIGRGHQLTDDQFDFLWNKRKGKAYETLLLKYLSTGLPLNEYQFNKISEED